jgi:alcohol dehydrogenase class IV
MLPAALRVNQRVREQELAQLERLFDSANKSDAESAASFIVRIESICNEVGIPSRLRDIGVTQSQIPELVTGSRGNSMSGNPKDVSDQELNELLHQIW